MTLCRSCTQAAVGSNRNCDWIACPWNRIERLAKAMEGLMDIAEVAMPDTYFKTDSRVNAAREILKELGIEK